MANRQITNCGDCAYAKKTDQGMWCPFHDEPVSSKLVCDDFLNEYESPQWKSLAAGMNENASSGGTVPQFTGKDLFVFVLTGIIFVLNIAIWSIPV